MKTGNKAWLRRWLYAAIVRKYLESEVEDGRDPLAGREEPSGETCLNDVLQHMVVLPCPCPARRGMTHTYLLCSHHHRGTKVSWGAGDPLWRRVEKDWSPSQQR